MPGTAVELQDPLGGVVQEVAVVGHRHHGAGELLQELLEPVDALGIEVVGRLVQQQHVGLGQQQPAQRNAALLAAGQRTDLRVPGRQAQRVGGDLELVLDVVAGARGDDRLVLRLLGGELVEVGVRLRVRGVDLVELLLCLDDLAHALLDRLAHGLLGVQLRLLRQEADADAGHRDGFAFDVLVLAGHDAQQAGLARAVQAEHPDLGAGEKGQRDVLQDGALRRDDLADAVHGVDVLGHGGGKGEERRGKGWGLLRESRA